jgi:copper(I)-binding protein
VGAVATALLAGCGGEAVSASDPSSPQIVGMYVGATPARFDAAAYVVIEQRGGDDELVAVTARGVDLVTTMEAGAEMGPDTTASTSAPAGFPVTLPAGARTVFGPGGDHLMFSGLERDLVPGDVVRVTFDFARHPDVVIDAQVVQPADLLDIDIFWEDAA